MPTIHQRTATALAEDPECLAVYRVNAWSAQYQALYVGRIIAVHVCQLHVQTLRIEQAGTDSDVGKWLAGGGEYQIWAWGKRDEDVILDDQWQVEVTPILLPDGWLERWMEKREKEASDV